MGCAKMSYLNEVFPSVLALNFVATELVTFENVIPSPWEKLFALEKISYGRLK